LLRAAAPGKNQRVTAEAVLGYWSGLALLAPEMPFTTLWRTMLIVHICDAVVCGILAANGGRPRWPWTAIGFVGGIWVLVALLLLPARNQRGKQSSATT